MKNRLTALLLLGFLTGTSLLSFLLPDRFFSVREKRKLQQLPEISTEKLLDKTFLPELEDYLTDQFPGRDGWIALKTVSEMAMGRRERSGVYIGTEGYLMDAFRQYDPDLLAHNLSRLQTLQTRLGDIPMKLLLVPAACQILEDRLPDAAPAADPGVLEEAARRAGLETVEVRKVLEEHRDEPIYYRTDHHYTSLGAWYCWQTWQRSRGADPGSADDWTREVLTDQFRGTTWTKVGLPWIRPDSITAWYRQPHRVVYNGTEERPEIYERSRLEKDPYAVFLNSNQALSVIQGSGAEGKLLLIKDSFGNTFAQFPAEDFREVHVIDLRFFREDPVAYARENGITEVLVLYGAQNFSTQTRILLSE